MKSSLAQRSAEAIGLSDIRNGVRLFSGPVAISMNGSNRFEYKSVAETERIALMFDRYDPKFTFIISYMETVS